MGQKVSPHGLRVGVIKDWDSRWYAEADFADNLIEDHEIRTYLKKRLYSAGISKIEIERAGGKVRLILSTARPGIVIGRKGVEIEKLRGDLVEMALRDRAKRAGYTAVLMQGSGTFGVESVLTSVVGQQLERRVAFRRAMKRTVSLARKFGGEGIKVTCAGRLAGAEIARTEWYRDGRVPLQTLRADISYGFAEARTTYGIIGVKVWIYKGEILDKEVDQ